MNTDVKSSHSFKYNKILSACYTSIKVKYEQMAINNSMDKYHKKMNERIETKNKYCILDLYEVQMQVFMEADLGDTNKKNKYMDYKESV